MSPISRGPAPRLVFLSWHINKVSIYLSIYLCINVPRVACTLFRQQVFHGKLNISFFFGLCSSNYRPRKTLAPQDLQLVMHQAIYFHGSRCCVSCTRNERWTPLEEKMYAKKRKYKRISSYIHYLQFNSSVVQLFPVEFSQAYCISWTWELI